MVDEALEIAGRGSGTTALPELQLLKGDLLLALGRADDPEPWFRRALDIAQHLDARMSQLEPPSGSAGSGPTRTVAPQSPSCAPSTTPSPKASPRPT
jgi:hypothetical protein